MKYVLLLLITINFHSEAMFMDDDLEKFPESSFETSLTNFTDKGGTFIELDGDTFPYKISKGDVVFPSCSAATNRSQIVWNLLRKYEPQINVMPPHGTRYGFDPYNDSVNWHRSSNKIPPEDEFLIWAGVERAEKFGWDQFASWLSKNEATAEELALLWQYYTDHYYAPQLDGRRVYITFEKNAHVHLHRLSQTNESLHNVVLLVYPLPDAIKEPFPEWNASPRSKETYLQLAALIMKYLDLSELAEEAAQNEETLQESDIAPLHL